MGEGGMKLRGKYWVTLDKVDGSTVQKGPFYADEINTFGMLMYLNARDVAGVTITRADPLQRLEVA
jgi:hypothetical protein